MSHGFIDASLYAALPIRINRYDLREQNDHFWVTRDNVFVTKNPAAIKPYPDYYKALKAMVKARKHDAENIIFVDDKKENVDGATKAGIIATQLKLAKGNAKDTDAPDIYKAVEAMKKEFAAKGVQFDAE